MKWIRWAEERTDCRELLLVGGVAANLADPGELQRRLPNWCLFAHRYSVDNALEPPISVPCGRGASSALTTKQRGMPVQPINISELTRMISSAPADPVFQNRCYR